MFKPLMNFQIFFGLRLSARPKYTGDLMKDFGWDKMMSEALNKREPEMKTLEKKRYERKFLKLEAGEEKDIGVLDPTSVPTRVNSRAIIKRRPKSVTQQGTYNANHWELYFDTKERWENPTMGWSSSGDSFSNLRLKFVSRDAAISFAEHRGWCYEVDDEDVGRRGKCKPRQDYKMNFHWCKRTRTSTK